MPDIDFSQINSLKNGQRDAFEELVCQLARREAFPSTAEFRRVDGKGGDGGVEAYWLQRDGTKHGYQAKFFLRSGDIDWSQVDKSVVQALETHPTLKTYTVAFPCNLTDRSGRAGRGKTGWEHWAAHVARWQEHAASLKMSPPEFRTWTQSELIDRLARPAAAGLKLFWFGGAELTSDWFSRQIDGAVALLDERFHPEDHVDVGLQNLFEIVSRHPKVVSELRDMFAKLRAFVVLTAGSAVPDELPDRIEAARTALLRTEKELDLSAEQPWNSTVWLDHAKKLQSAVDALRSWLWKRERKQDEAERTSGQHDQLRDLRDSISAFGNLVEAFVVFVSRRYFQAERDRFAIVEGPAGSGKSHLFGHEAKESLKRRQPAILLLGQQFSAAEPWAQIADLLDLGGVSADAILGALDSAAEAGRTIGLILIDGVNEGIGSNFWRSHLAGFIAKIKSYSHLACILSCRSEYVPHAFPTELYDRSAKFTITGFLSVQEKTSAARVYLDQRGIARPSTPWLTPEFVNPLFLRTTCLALSREGKHEFPKGLRGTRSILAYYLNSVGRNLNAGRDGTDDLVGATKAAVLGIANRMADLRQDYLSRADASHIADEAFSLFTPPPGKSWMEVLHLAGLFRFDPHPCGENTDPMAPSPDVVRFCFQRFQDHLMGQALLRDIKDPKAAFAPDGKLGFVLSEGRVDLQWAGLFDALGTLFPEQYAMELIDALPGKFESWWWSFASTFVESVKWRAYNAFSDRSLELLNRLDDGYDNRTALLIELSVSTEHPWNAELVHRNLWAKSLAERDGFWTVRINGMSDEDDSPAGQLMDWCLVGQTEKTAIENQRLAGLMLCWFFTASNRAIRDKATKALASVIGARPEIFPELLAQFAMVNDLYVLERLLAAGFAACSLDQDAERAGSYAAVVFDHIFKDGHPPHGLLLRDYALGIVERASALGKLPRSVELSLCRPPYSSPKLAFCVTDKQLQKIADAAGGEDILRSATGMMGDFAKYEVSPAVRNFLAVPLSVELTLSADQRLTKFRDEVVGESSERRTAFAALERIANPYSAGMKPMLLDGGRRPQKKEIAAWQESVRSAQSRFLQLLNARELELFRSEAQQALHKKPADKTKKPPRIDARKAQRWVANQAYKLGWTADLFPHDTSSGMSYSRDRPRTERIGKKYQWLALDELLCRLSDNNWFDPGYGGLPRHYKYPHDVGFHRDIDPTIVTSSLVEQRLEDCEGPERWPGTPWIALDIVTDEQLAAWPFADSVEVGLDQLVHRADTTGKKWTVLYEHQVLQSQYTDKGRDHGLRQQEFRFVYAAQVRKASLQSLVNSILEDKSLDTHTWEPRNFTDEQFLGEAPWRPNWPQRRWNMDSWGVATELDIAFPVFEYHWESHLDVSLPNGARSHVPAPWLAKQLGLTPKSNSPGIWVDDRGTGTFVSYRGDDGNQCVLLDATAIPKMSDDGAVLIWLLIAEKNAWPGGHNANASWRRIEGICWPDGGKLRSETWHKDGANGTSSDLLKKHR